MKLSRKRIDKGVLLDLVSDRIISCKMGLNVKEILKELINFYQDPNNIIEICTRRELNLLNEILNGSIDEYIKTNNLQFEFDSLTSKFIIDENFKIYDELIMSVKKALIFIDYGKKVSEDKIKRGIVSLCKVCGKIDLKELYRLMEKIYGVDHSLVNRLIDSKLINYYVVLINRHELLYRDYRLLDIKVKLNYNFSPNELDNIFYNDYDISDIKIKKMYNYLISSPNYPVIKKIIDGIIISSNDRDSLYEALQVMYKDNVYDVFNEGLDEILKYYKLKTGISGFYNILNRLLDYTNKKEKVTLKRVLDDNSKVIVKDYFFKNKDRIIDSFISEEPLSLEEEGIINEIKMSSCQSLILVNSSSYLELMDKSGTVYMVKNIYNFDDSYTMVDAYLIMYEGMIIPAFINSKGSLNSCKDTIDKNYKNSSKVYSL